MFCSLGMKDPVWMVVFGEIEFGGIRCVMETMNLYKCYGQMSSGGIASVKYEYGVCTSGKYVKGLRV